MKYKARSVELGQWVYVKVVRGAVGTSNVFVRNLGRFIKVGQATASDGRCRAIHSGEVLSQTGGDVLVWRGSADRHDGTVAAFGYSARRTPMSFLDDVLELMTTSDLSVGFSSPSLSHRTGDDSTDPFIKAVHVDGHLQRVERILHDRIGI